MREIKFRAWDNGTNAWHNFDGREVGFTPTPPLDVFEIISSDGLCVTEQFTGRKDKKGVDIYSADIIRRGDEIAVVSWNPEYSAFVWQLLKSYKQGFNGGNFDFMTHHNMSSNVGHEVVGNIHQNPELLEESK